MATTKSKCIKCNKVFYPRTVDVKRGWAKCCSKACAAFIRERNKPQTSDDDLDGAEDGSWDAHKFWTD